ncbi:hypothetical protein E2C01_010688 [Portunus trituberculatus]|uniref:Uncharacterized protein n=1 Tax=Portunus trituberculatus TaxID=210409 RepID=A0A5B7D942_PORTR|nr:hypothetical protein [Portunus trituberculatus]
MLSRTPYTTPPTHTPHTHHHHHHTGFTQSGHFRVVSPLNARHYTSTTTTHPDHPVTTTTTTRLTHHHYTLSLHYQALRRLTTHTHLTPTLNNT